MKESKAMKEIHDIRERHYEETKNMTSTEYLAKVKAGASIAKKKIEEIRKSRIVGKKIF